MMDHFPEAAEKGPMTIREDLDYLRNNLKTMKQQLVMLSDNLVTTSSQVHETFIFLYLI